MKIWEYRWVGIQKVKLLTKFLIWMISFEMGNVMSSLLVINPNTSFEMTDQIMSTIQKIAHKEHEESFE